MCPLKRFGLRTKRPSFTELPDPSRLEVGRLLNARDFRHLIRGVHFAGAFGMVEHESRLIDLLSYSGYGSSNIRAVAAQALEQAGTKNCIEPLMGVLGEDSNTAVAASDTLFSLANRHQEYFPSIGHLMLKKKNIRFQRGAAEVRFGKMLNIIGKFGFKKAASEGKNK